MMNYNIKPVGKELEASLQHKIDNKTKPLGSLGVLEQIALRIGMIQNTLEPQLNKPTIVVFAGDHGIAKEGVVNAYPQDVTWQMVFNFLGKGAAINVLSENNGIDVKVVDAGVNYDFPVHPDLIDAKIAKGTRNYMVEPAMTAEQCQQAMAKGAEIVAKLHADGTNIIGFGEMGIGNTSSASIILSLIANISIEECVGRGTGLDDERLAKKREALAKAINAHGKMESAFEILTTFGGFEIAMICGAMLKAAELRMVIINDGFIVTSALMVASELCPNVMDYCVFAHNSDEFAHVRMLEYLNSTSLLHLGMRLGEGTGAAVAYPLIESAVVFLNKMASFESAGVDKEK